MQNSRLNPFPPSLQARILGDPYYRLRSLDEIKIAASLGLKIDVNQACVDDWLRLPGLSIHQAHTLVKLKEAGVQFYCLEDIAAALGIPIQRLQPLGLLLAFQYYDREHLDGVQKVNLNQTSIEALMKIPGIGHEIAIAIYQNRIKSGPYKNLIDLQQRLSLPGSVLSALLHTICF
jgi:DNA uptake protein ComE-like DNA-binding protein